MKDLSDMYKLFQALLRDNHSVTDTFAHTDDSNTRTEDSILYKELDKLKPVFMTELWTYLLFFAFFSVFFSSIEVIILVSSLLPSDSKIFAVLLLYKEKPNEYYSC
jgi:hypothetical protein